MLEQLIQSRSDINWLVFNIPAKHYSTYWMVHYECLAIGFSNGGITHYIDRDINSDKLRCHCTPRKIK